MPHLTSTIPQLGRPGFEWISVGTEDLKTQLTEIVGRTISSNKDYEDFRAITDFGYANDTNEGDSIIIDSVSSPFSLQVRPIMRTLGFEISKQGKFTDLYDKVKNPLRLMGEAMTATRNLQRANVLALGFTAPSSGGTKTLDNVALFKTDHAISGGTSGNRPAADLTFSATNLETAKTQLRQQPTHRGKPTVMSGDVYLIVPNTLEMQALRVVESVQQAGTANNDKNVIGSRCKVLVADYITTASLQDAWWLMSSEKMKSPIVEINRIPMHLDEQYDAKTKMHFFGTGEEYIYIAAEWRAMWGTNP